MKTIQDHGGLVVPPRLALEGIGWVLLVIIAWGWSYSTSDQQYGPVIFYIAFLSLVVGMRAFIGHGGGKITATGLFAISTAMFVGLSAFIVVGEGPPRAGWENLTLACLSGLTVQVGAFLLAYRRKEFFNTVPFWVGRRAAVWMTRAGLLMLFISAIAFLGLPSVRSSAAASAFSAICILSCGLLLREKVRLVSWGTAVLLASVVVYVEFFHSGTGRLHIVALGCAIAVVASMRFPYLRLKVGIVLAIPVALIWLAIDRLALEASLGSRSMDGRTGLESMVAGLKVFSLMLESYRNGQFSPSYGYNLLSVPALLIPDAMWEGKPIALGYELVRFDNPSRYGDGIFSTVSTSTGEAIYNFGWLGLPIAVLFAATITRFFDAWMASKSNSADRTILSALALAIMAIFIGAIADYTWSGVHTYVARMLRRLPAFLVILYFAWIWQRRYPILRSRKRSRRAPVSDNG